MSDNPQSEGAVGVVRYFVTDHLGSTTKLINTDSLAPALLGTDFKFIGQRDPEVTQGDYEGACICIMRGIETLTG